MVRPKKLKKTSQTSCKQFVPITNFCFSHIIISKEESEAIKLHDLEHLEQKQAALKMQISQPTFHRLLASSRKKIADALINIKEIRIE